MSHKITIEGGKSVRLPTAGKYCDRDIVVTAEGGTPTPTQEKTVEITANGSVSVAPDEGYALSKVTANVNVPIPEGYIQPSGTLEVTENGTKDVTAYASVNVNVPTGGGGEDHLDDLLTNTLTAIDSDVTSIASYGCYGRTALKTLNLPKCTKINSNAFRGCSGITSVNAPLLVTADTYSFYGCSKITELDMSRLTTVGTNAFYKCDLRNVDAPLVSGISQNAFFQNENLVRADFGKATKLNQSGLANCSSLVTLILRSSTICTLGTASSSLLNTPIAEGTGYVYVPAALIETYKTATNWVNYASQFRAIEDYPEICGG